MNLLRTLLLAGVLATGLSSAPALAERPRDRNATAQAQAQAQQQRGPHREQERAFEGRREGRTMALPQLESKVMPLMDGADYLGPEFNGPTLRMKFIQKNGRVVWVDVDPQTGRIIRRSRDR